MDRQKPRQADHRQLKSEVNSTVIGEAKCPKSSTPTSRRSTRSAASTCRRTSLATSLQRLSSGLRINSAKDDAAGLAISTA
jgi:hypothetical protein